MLVGAGDEGGGVVVVEGLGVGHVRPSRTFRQPAGALGVGVGVVPGVTSGGGAFVVVVVTGAGSGFGPLGPPKT